MTRWVYEAGGCYVAAQPCGGWVVFRPSRSGTYAESDSAFPAGVDGLGCAIARVMYLARGTGGRGLAVEAQKTAESLLAKGKALGARNRAALAAFDADFMR